MGRVIYDADHSDQWFTPAPLRALAHEVLGRVDVDPATSRRNPLRAQHFLTARGLAKPWDWFAPGHPDLRLWLNPPYGPGVGEWMERAAAFAAVHPFRRGLALVGARPGARWYAAATRGCQLFCELHGRQRFEGPDGQPAADCARWGSVLLYWGPSRARVARILAPHGEVRLVRPSPRRPPLQRLADQRQIRLFRDPDTSPKLPARPAEGA